MNSNPNEPAPLESAMDKMSVAPGPESDTSRKGPVGSADAGTDKSITERLERNPQSKDARLDRALDESMDASDPPASTQPIHNQEPPESSGYDPKAEKKLTAKNEPGVVGKVLSKIGLG
ncbi:hypothetical protein [Sphingomonas xinjiangensis]|uniref:Uncharacterized protein n=1 Tax=Sphingomonas xinjiangensis TaxID=643568 RepID=A0A840YNM5_9SPHN|nr:hypothetical protein [Sphingomonas xinjiangensis]MBB5711906.1 hypothetical protein [Sphingomonas xinjiangensis]